MQTCGRRVGVSFWKLNGTEAPLIVVLSFFLTVGEGMKGVVMGE